MVDINMQIRFVKLFNRWFADLPFLNINIDDAEMVYGADKLLDIISEGKGELFVLVTTNFCTTHDVELTLLEDQEEDDYGRYYEVEIYNKKHKRIIGTPIWLCPVTVQLFGKYPEKIYILI